MSLSIADWLQTDDKMCIDIVSKKYLIEEDILGHKETVDELLDRISGGNKEARELIRNRKFIPGGRIIANRGLQNYGLKVTYSNCYVDPAPEDNIESIYNTCSRLARTFSYGGGIGIDISKLAPAGAKVNNTARHSTGAVSFVNTFSEVSETIGMKGRRGALMISIDGSHPDLKEFITHKSDLGVTQGANMSVRMSDEFFEAVKNDKDWVLSFTRKETGETIEKIVKAKEIMHLIAKTNWDYAEPGLLYWDTMCKYNLMSEDPNFEYAGTNPCVTGDTNILTEFGYAPIESLVAQTINIWNGYEWVVVTPKLTGINQPIVEIEFSDGSFIKCTKYHRFIMESGEDDIVQAYALKIGDHICKTEYPIIIGYTSENVRRMYTKGYIAGTEKGRSIENNSIHISSEKDDVCYYIDYDKLTCGDISDDIYCLNFDPDEYMIADDINFVPSGCYDIQSRLSWLSGYLDANGEIDKSNNSIFITSTNRNILYKIKLLLNTLGCNGVISEYKEKTTNQDTFFGSKDNISITYKLTINAFYVNRLVKLDLSTLNLIIKPVECEDESENPTVVNIKDLGIASSVYCVTDPKRHSVVFESIRTGNCGEEPLPAGGSCLLGAMNLSEYWIDNKFAHKKFMHDVRVAVRYLNEVLDEGQNLHPLPEQRKTVSDLRQIGLGFMGLADLFIKAKVRYGSKESVDLVHEIGYRMIFAAIQESALLAKEKGAFAKYTPNLITQSRFFINNVNNNPYIDSDEKYELLTMVSTFGLRNSQLLTCAPTGTISTIFNVSGGIEPIFALQFTRTTKSIYDEDRTYTVYPSGVKYYLDNEGISSLDDVKEFPDYLVTSRDIDWKGRIDVQAAWQMHIDASISATINLPESTTVDEVAELYMYGHDAGLKGTTVFRENCKRIAILYDSFKKKDEDKKEEPKEVEKEPDKHVLESVSQDVNYIEVVKNKFKSTFSNILTRADFSSALHGVTHYARVACGHIYITVNRYQGRPVEVFMQSSKSGGCSANTEALGRMASTMLRAGIDPDIVVDSVLGVKCSACSAMKGKGELIDGLSCSDVMARVIKEEYQKYKDGVYDNEIQEWLDSVSDEYKYYLLESSKPHTCSCGGNCSCNGKCHSKETSLENTDNKTDISDTGWNYKEHTIQENLDMNICPNCGDKLRMSEGCFKCINCGYSKC